MLDVLKVFLATTICLGVGSWVAHSFNMSKRNPRKLPLPPGPRGLPFLGQAREVSTGKLWETFQTWSQKYGDIVYVEVMGQGMIGLHTLDTIRDLFEKRGQNFSDRPRPPSLDMLYSGMPWNWALYNSGPVLTANRRVFHKAFGPREVLAYLPVVEEQVAIYVQRLGEDPANFASHTKDFFANTLIHVSYGGGDGSWTKRMAERIEGVGLALVSVFEPGRFFVDLFPPLRNVPTWFPGAGWKRYLTSLSAYTIGVYDTTYEEAMARWRNGSQGPHHSVLKSLLSELPPEDSPAFSSQADLIVSNSFVANLAGVDTQTSSTLGLILALGLHPQVQQKCHEELDAVVGACRLPKPSDLDNLHYIRAVVEEVFRWHLPLPFGLPHVVREDEEYNGYFIPKGTLVFANNWAVTRDASVYSDPWEFRPERYLKNGKCEGSFFGSDAPAFGLGRRICPGRHMAIGTMVFMVAALMAVFEITPAKDEEGNDVPLRYSLESGLVSNPTLFKCNIIPRSEAHRSMTSDPAASQGRF